MKTNEIKYSNYGIIFVTNGVTLAQDVTACDMDALKSDVLAAYPDARIVQICPR